MFGLVMFTFLASKGLVVYNEEILVVITFRVEKKEADGEKAPLLSRSAGFDAKRFPI